MWTGWTAIYYYIKTLFYEMIPPVSTCMLAYILCMFVWMCLSVFLSQSETTGGFIRYITTNPSTILNMACGHWLMDIKIWCKQIKHSSKQTNKQTNIQVTDQHQTMTRSKCSRQASAENQVWDFTFIVATKGFWLDLLLFPIGLL